MGGGKTEYLRLQLGGNAASLRELRVQLRHLLRQLSDLESVWVLLY